MKELKNKSTKFYTYKLKQGKSFKVVLKHIHTTANLDDIKKEIEDLGHIVTNIWNFKKQGIKKVLHMFYVELKSKSIKASTRLAHFLIAELNLNYHMQNVRFLNVLIARNTGI